MSEHQHDLWELAIGDLVEYIPPRQSPEVPGREIGEVRRVGELVIYVYFPRIKKVEPTGLETLRPLSYWEAKGMRFSGEI